jgi:hypothetical protein
MEGPHCNQCLETEMELKSESINELAGALAKAQGEFTTAKKSADNPFFKSRYADLAEVVAACRAPLAKHGLCVIQQVVRDEAGVMLRSTLAHSSGQWIASEYPARPVRVVKDRDGKATEVEANDPQSVGSAITYARRYSLAALVGVVTDDDDDGNAASGRDAQAPQMPQNRPAQPKPIKAPPAKQKSIPDPIPAASEVEDDLPIDTKPKIPAVKIAVGAFAGRMLASLTPAECGSYYVEIMESITAKGLDPKRLPSAQAQAVFDYVFHAKGAAQ